MLQYLVAGVVIGCIYALTATSVVVTFVSSGILNLAVAAMAYFDDRLYYWLRVGRHWPVVPAAVVAILVVGPVLGLVLWALLFRWIRFAPRLIQAASTIGLAVAIPPLTAWIFGNKPILSSPGLAPQPVHTWRVGGVAVTADQLIAVVAVVAVMLAATLILRYTAIGLQVRAVVDSEALARLGGTNPQRVAATVWAFSSALAALAGVLVAPIISLSIDNYTALTAAAFAAAAAAKLVHVGRAVLFAFLLGIITALVQGYLPSASTFTAAAIPSVPFVFVAVFLLAYSRRGALANPAGLRGLDLAITPSGRDVAATGAADTGSRRGVPLPVRASAALALAVVVPLALDDLWVGALALGVAYGIAMLSFIVATGEGGMLWLCLITFAGIGSVLTGQLSAAAGMPVLLAVLVAALATTVLGVLVGVLTVRMGDVYVALATLTFGLLVDNLVFSRERFLQFGSGVLLNRPAFIASDRGFLWFSLVVFAVLGGAIAVLRRTTLGQAITAARYSASGARAIGVNPVLMRIVCAALAAFVAAIGGGLLSLYDSASIPSSYVTFTGFTWFALVASLGLRSIMAALVGGLVLSVLPLVFLTWLPASLANLPPALFGLGAVLIALNPEGSVMTAGRSISRWGGRLRRPSPVRTAAADGLVR